MLSSALKKNRYFSSFLVNIELIPLIKSMDLEEIHHISPRGEIWEQHAKRH